MKTLKLAAIVALIGLAGCKSTTAGPSPVCEAIPVAAAAGSSAVASVLACSHVGAIAADMTDTLNGLSLCSGQAKGVVGNLVCPAVASFAGNAVTAKIPPTWGCTGGVASAQVVALVTQACQKAIPY